MKIKSAAIVLTLILYLGIEPGIKGQTFCNPIALPRPVAGAVPVSSNLADPTIVLFRDTYFLFATNAGGYWYSSNLLHWKFLSVPLLPFDKVAPVAFVYGDWMYFCTSFSGSVFRSKNPVGGEWELYCDNSALLSELNDFAIFVDTDKKVYCYYGCTNNDGVMMRQLDPVNQFNPIGVPLVCQKINPFKKVKKDQNTNFARTQSLPVTGSWMNKYNGRYYFQCTEPIGDQGTPGNAVYVSDNPQGPFTFAANNPFFSRPDGFLSNGGNGSTFADKYGNWWHITVLLAPENSVNQSYLGLIPAGFDKDGNLFTKTEFCDYPVSMPNHTVSGQNKMSPEWTLLSDHCKAEASSVFGTSPVNLAFDENVGTCWSAQSGKKGEWLLADLGDVCHISAVQLNFAVNQSFQNVVDSLAAYRYLVEYSSDKKNWKVLVNETRNTECLTNPYHALTDPVEAQYVKITNVHVPSGNFAISGFRVFGSGNGNKPKKVNDVKAVRDYRNPQVIRISWKKQSNTRGFNVRYGTAKDKLYHSHQVFKKNKLTINCPDKYKTYWLQVDAYNENGVSAGKAVEIK